MTNTQLLRQRIKESGLKLQYIADYLGIKQQSVNDLLNRALKTMKKKAENEEF